jgi:FkbM family methyltransferase
MSPPSSISAAAPASPRLVPEYFSPRQAHTIEANPDNYPSLNANLGPYSDRAIIVNGGVWWRRTPLAIRRQNEGDAGVRETRPEDVDLMEGWDLPALMERAGFTHVDLLKIDIEGAEVELLLKNAERWLPRVRNLSIELHGPECEAALERALEPYTYQRQVLGELVFCFHLRPKNPLPETSQESAHWGNFPPAQWSPSRGPGQAGQQSSGESSAFRGSLTTRLRVQDATEQPSTGADVPTGRPGSA